ncbi:MAG: hypothetical protein E7485_09610 [Ruminococcaceae bacterium]|nr:hypothetical protein [Oscillospiraceae bacterium]
MKKVTRSTQDKKMPMSHEHIYKLMLLVTFAVSGVFLIINLIRLNVPGIIAIGGCMVVFLVALILMKKRMVKREIREMVLAVGLEVMIFAISLFSGESYSDDFPMFLCAIAITGLYMKPFYTKLQLIVADVLLVAMYVINPEKSEGLSQYLLCLGIFSLAGFIIYLVIKRGRAFIDINRLQAVQSENILWDMQEMGNKIQSDFNNSSDRIKESARALEQGSVSIISSATDVANLCHDVHDRVNDTAKQIKELNRQVRKFEEALSDNDTNMSAMTTQLQDVNKGILDTSAAVNDMKVQMNEVAAIAEQLGTISFKTTLLSLNASVEASHAGSAGAGFAVVAAEMKELSENSDRFSERVSEVVGQLLNQVEIIADQFAASTRAIERSEETMAGLQQSFEQLTHRFDSLYENIEQQNQSVEDVNNTFMYLNSGVDEVKRGSSDNMSTVSDIVKIMADYRENISRVVENTRLK